MFYSCIHLCFLCPICRNIITNSNVLLVQFVSDLSVTSDGFMASYTSIPRGLRTPTAGGDVVSGPRVSSTATRPRLTPVKPVKPVVFTTEATTTTTTEQPKPRPKPVRPIKPVRRPVSNPEPDESRPGEKEIRETNDAVMVDYNLLNIAECLSQPQARTQCVQRHVKEMEPSKLVSALVILVSHYLH